VARQVRDPVRSYPLIFDRLGLDSKSTESTPSLTRVGVLLCTGSSIRLKEKNGKKGEKEKKSDLYLGSSSLRQAAPRSLISL